MADREGRATRGDSLDFEARLEHRLERLEARFDDRLESLEGRIAQLILESEGRVIASIDRLTEAVQRRA